MSVSRRGFLGGSLGAAALLGLGACSNVHSGTGDNSSSTPPPPPNSSGAGKKSHIGKVKGNLTFATWASASEEIGFKRVIKNFERANPGATVTLKVEPYTDFFSNIDRQIQAGKAPDIFRVDYTTLGQYSSNSALLDLSPYFTAAESNAFLAPLWGAVKLNGTPYGVPQEVDTTCVVYSKAAFQQAGITSVPDSLDNAWTWEEFAAVAAKLRKSLPSNKYPFAYDWTAAGAFRWLSWLYQAGGTLLTSDLSKCALPSDAATKAMDFTKSFFDKKWVPANNTVNTSVYSDNFFLNQTVAMSFVGDFLVPELADPKTGYKGGDWGATFMPRDKQAASDLGGNALVALKTVSDPELAAAFLKSTVSVPSMKYFCEQAVELPTLSALSTAKLNYAFRPDVVEVCAEQAKTISQTIVNESTVSAFNDINTVLQQQLEAAFHGQSSEATIANIASGVNKALG
jgi:multiple sugar transport system substrate-binding protein